MQSNSDWFTEVMIRLIKDRFNQIIIEEKEKWVWIRFRNKDNKALDFKFPKKQIEEFNG